MYVSKENVDMVGIYDVMARGTAEIYHQEQEDFFLKDLQSGTYMLTVRDPEKGIRWLQENERANYTLMEMWQQECADYCQSRYRFEHKMECRQAVWLQDSPTSDKCSSLQIREPEDAEMAFILKEYTVLEPAEMEQVRALHQLYVGCLASGEIAGFVGMHLEGSIGMLKVLPQYRRRGYAAELERFMIQRTIEMGLVPFGQIEVWNEASISLQQKMGMVISEKSIFWLF